MIPTYQFGSLSGDNVAKKRVMKKAHVAFETEEQRATKRGKSKEDANNLLKLINENLQLQITALDIAEASILRGEDTGNEDTDIYPEIQGGFLNSMGRAITLAYQLKSLLAQFAPTYQLADVGNIAKMQGLLADLNISTDKLVDTVRSQQDLADTLGIARLDVDRLFRTYSKAVMDCELFIENILSKGYTSDVQDLVLDTVGRETELLFERLGIPYIDWEDEESSATGSEFEMTLNSARSSRSGIRGLNRGRQPAFSQHTGSAQSAQLMSSSDSDNEDEESSSEEEASQASQASRRSGASNRGRVEAGMGLYGGALYQIPHYRKIHNMSASYAYPIRYA